MTHMLDTRRPEGRRYIGELREDGTGYRGQVNQFPVICAIDFVEQEVTMRSRDTQVISRDGKNVKCPDCRERMGL